MDLLAFLRYNKKESRVENMERLQKFLSRCGVASRRKAEEWIQEGKVTVNDVTVTQMGYQISEKDIVKVDNQIVQVLEKKYYAMNKPRYIISSVNDDKNRKTVVSILPEALQQEHLFPVGRLDYDTKGVLLLTNDGTFMNQLVGPRSTLEKEYIVRVQGIVTKLKIKKLENGLQIDNYRTRKCIAKIDSIDRKNQSTLVRIILQEGKYHQVKKMFAAIGHEVKRLTRIRFGNILIEGLKEGKIRPLSIHEIKQLYVLSQQDKEFETLKARKF